MGAYCMPGVAAYEPFLFFEVSLNEAEFLL